METLDQLSNVEPLHSNSLVLPDVIDLPEDLQEHVSGGDEGSGLIHVPK